MTGRAEFPDLLPLVRPASVAVVGASPNPRKSPGRIIPNLDRTGFAGPVYPVNPKYTEVNGRPCYPRVTAIPGPVDTAVIMVPAEHVVPAVRDCAAHGVRFAVILSSGFAEIGGAGVQRQAELKEAIRGTGLRVYGPNCPGIWMVRDRMAFTFSPRLETDSWLPGPVGLVTQGGAMGRAILDVMDLGRLGFSYWFSPGNEADLELSDFIAWLADDPDTRVVLAIAEGFRDGERFIAAARRCREAGKPLIVMKVGRSEEGSRAAASHTGAVATSDRVVDAVLRQVGAIRVDDVDEMVDLAELVVRCGVQALRGVGICTMSGGSGAIVADMCGYMGVPLPSLAPETVAGLRAVLPEIAAVGNPVDMTTEIFQHPEHVQKSLELIVNDPRLDAVLVPFPYRLGAVNTHMAQQVVAVSQKTNKPLIALGVSASFQFEEAARILHEARIPVMRSASKGILAVRRYLELGRIMAGSQDQAAGSPPVAIPSGAREKARSLLPGCRGALSEDESRAVLAAYGIPFPRAALARSAEEAVRAAEEIGYPVVLKVSSRQILHKSDAGLVVLGAASAGAVARAYDDLVRRARDAYPEAEVRGVQVLAQAPEGVEVIAGIKRDPAFGPVVLFGLGGVFVEVLSDVAMRLAPVSPAEARALIREVRGYKLLTGIRGRPPADVDALADVLVRLSRLAVDLGDCVAEIDINPLRVLPAGQGAIALDALIVAGGEGDR